MNNEIGPRVDINEIAYDKIDFCELQLIVILEFFLVKVTRPSDGVRETVHLK